VQLNSQIKPSLVDALVSAAAFPNRARVGTPVANGAYGTLTIRRRFTNKTGQAIKFLRFRISDITTMNSPLVSNPQADLRAIDSTDVLVNYSNGTSQVVRGTRLEQRATNANGGGVNSTLLLTLAGGMLQPNASVDVQFTLGVQSEGNFRFFVNVEALTQPQQQNASTQATPTLKAPAARKR
jgi:hypothetical protein